MSPEILDTSFWIFKEAWKWCSFVQKQHPKMIKQESCTLI